MPYRSRGPSITRQLTDDEEALDTRASSFLQSQSSMPAAFGTAGQRYAWMEKDLKMRAMQAASLSQESQLAGDLGDKKALAAQDAAASEEELQARRGLEHVEGLVAGGMDYDEAIHRTSVDMDLGLNDVFGKAAKDRSALYESPEEKELRQSKQALEKLQVGKSSFDVKMAMDLYEKNPDLYETQIKNKADSIRQEGTTAANAKVASDLKAMEDRIALKRIQETQDLWKGSLPPEEPSGGSRGAAGASTGNLDQQARLAWSFEQSGLGGVTHPDKLIRKFQSSPVVLNMLADRDFIRKEVGDNPAFAKALNSVVGETGNQVETDPDGDTVNQAMSLIMTIAGKHDAVMGPLIAEKGREDVLRKVGADVFSDDEKLGKQINDILSAKDESTDDESRKSFSKNQTTQIRDGGLAVIKKAKVAAGLDPDINTTEEQAIWDKSGGTPQEMASLVREQIAQFAGKLPKSGVLQKEQEARKATLDKSVPASKAPPQQTKPSGMPTVKDKAGYDALPSGTTYIGPDGKRAIKP